jgi:hypothetical protein
LVEAALAEPRCFPLKKKIAPPHPTQKPPYSFANARVPIAEVLEWQGRHKEAISHQVPNSHDFVHLHQFVNVC